MPCIEPIENDKVPYELLYLADEDDDQINKYRGSAIFWAAKKDDEILGMIGLNELNTAEIEIVCIAVYEKYENRKIGTELIEQAIAYSKKKLYKEIIIKTGNAGIKQLYLYQRCGFRLDSVNKDYFIKNYSVPIYENSIRCPDQVVLRYNIYSDRDLNLLIKEYWERFIRLNPEYKNKEYETWNFCYGEYLPNKLIGLVKEGRKTGTSSALEMYDGSDETVPEAGGISIITYGNGLPGCIIETKDVMIRKFEEITDEEARLEGEGDLSLSYWRNAHEWFFKLEYEEKGLEFTEDIPVVFERFEVIYDEDRKGQTAEELQQILYK